MAQDDSTLPAAPVVSATDTLLPPDVPDPGCAAAPAPGASRRARRGRTPPAVEPPGQRRRGRQNLAQSVAGVLHKIIDAAKGLSRREFARVLAGILLILAMCAVIPIIDTVSPLGIVLYAVVCASLVIVLVKDEAVKKALIIMGIAVGGIVIATLTTTISKALDNRITAQPVPGPAQRRPVYGTVVDQTRKPLADVFVRARGDATSVQTDAAGRFSLVVVESSIRNDVVELYLIRAQQVDTVSQTLGDGEVTLVFGDTPAQPAAPSAAARSARNALAASPRPHTVPHGPTVAVIIDSIYTVFDGSWVGEAGWSFDVSVPDGTPIHIRKATYNDKGEQRQRMMVVGSETAVPLDADTLTVTVRGVREILALLRYRLRGTLTLVADEIPADRPLRREILVQDGDKWNNGQFRFYITILKLPA